MPSIADMQVSDDPMSPGHETVTLPDFFQDFLSGEPVVNPHFKAVGKESIEWIARFCNLRKSTRRKLEKLSFSYFCGICAPYASPAELRILCDWGNWIFLYDDLFDEGKLPYAESKILNESLLQPFLQPDVSPKPRARIVQAHDSIAFRMKKRCSKTTWDRYLGAMDEYTTGVLAHKLQGRPEINRMIEIRRDSVGAAPLYALIEFAHGLDIPAELRALPCVRELETLGKDMVAIMNDVLSYLKEEDDGTIDNIIAVYRLNGESAQEAFNAAGRLVDECHAKWREAIACISFFDPDPSSPILRYIDGIKAVVQANLEWSFQTHRYFGRDAGLVRDTLTVSVMQHPLYLSVN